MQTLNQFLKATLQLELSVNVKQIVVGIVDRFANYALKVREEAANAIGRSLLVFKLIHTKDDQGKEGAKGIPSDMQLFDIFWNQITELVKTRAEFLFEDTIALLVSLMGLALNCYPEHIEYVDQILEFAVQRFQLTASSQPYSFPFPLCLTNPESGRNSSSIA